MSYTVESILATLKLSIHLKPSASLRDVLLDAASIILPADSAVHNQISSNEVKLPSLGLLRAARVRLDLMSILFERQLFMQYTYIRYLLMDSSPQLGRNFYCIREDRVKIPRNMSIELRRQWDIQAHFESRIGTLSCFGQGHSGLTNKSLKTVNAGPMMECETENDFHDVRCQYKSACTDSGTERGVADDTIAVVQSLTKQYPADSPMSYLYPCMMPIPGHLHTIFNAFESAVKSLPFAKQWLGHINTLCLLLSNKQYRRRLLATCLKGKPGSSDFKSFSQAHVDWRWEVLVKVLNKLLPIYMGLQEHWNEKVMVTGESGVLDVALFREVTTVLETQNILEFGELVRFTGQNLERHAHKLEGCHCHGHIWMSDMSWKRKQAQMMEESGGHKTCIWKGRQGSWWVAEGLDEMLQSVRTCSSDTFKSMLDRMDVKSRTILVGLQSSLRNALYEELQDKFEFQRHIPVKMLGVFWCQLGGSLERSLKIYEECRDEYDRAVAAGHYGSLQRTGRIMLCKTTLCRQQLDEWHLRAVQIRSATLGSKAYVTLQEYALASFVERRVEELHRRIKLLGSKSTHISVPYLCAQLREEMNISSLRTSADFSAYCLSKWRQKNLLNNVLKLRVPEAKLALMSTHDKLECVYQADMETEFKAVSSEKAAQLTWHAQKAIHNVPQPVIPRSLELCVDYFKKSLVVGAYYSVPLDLYESARSTATCLVEGDGIDPVVAGCAAVEGELQEFDMGTDVVVFQLLRAAPEKKYRVPIPHDPTVNKKTCINVARCVIVSRNPTGVQQLAVSTDHAEIEKLDLLWFAKSMKRSLETCFRWQAACKISTVKPYPLPQSAFSDDDKYELPSIVGEPVSHRAVASSSQAVVQYDSPIAQTMIRHMVRCKAYMPGQGGNGPVDVNDLYEFDAGEIDRMVQSGLLVMSKSVFGEPCVVIDMHQVSWSALVMLQSPTQQIRLNTDRPMLQCSKTDLVFQLHAQGWHPSDYAGPSWKAGGDLVYQAGLKQPIAYFACLLQAEAVVAKNVCEIRHGALDGYYRALITMESGPRLQSLLQDMDGKSNNWFLQYASCSDGGGDGNCESDSNEAAGPAAIMDAPFIGDTGAACSVLFDSVVKSDGFARQHVDLGPGTTSCKVYFDNFTGSGPGSLKQRGFLTCCKHNCIRYKPVGDNETLHEFCLRSYAWSIGADKCQDKPSHLAYEPPESELDDLRGKLRVSPF